LAGEIFDSIEKFASYGFNKSHSAAYAFLTFQTAYLKAHHPAEFMAAVLTLEIGNSEKLMGFIAECRPMGMEVLPPDVQLSAARFRPEGENIRFGLAGIKGVGAAAVDVLVAERTKNGPFKGFMDFCSRVNSREVNKRCLESLIKAGAFDWSGITRARLFGGMDFALQRSESQRNDRAQGQTSLFDLLDGGGKSQGELSDTELPEAEPWPISEMLAFEKDLLGFYISGHPLEEFEWEIQTYASHKLEELGGLAEGSSVRVAGLITEWRKFFTKSETEMATFKLEGLTGGVQTAMYQETVQQYATGLHDNLPVMIAADVKPRDGETRLVVQEICALSAVPSWYAERVSLHLTEAQVREETLHELRELVKQHSGQTPLHFCVMVPGGERVFLSSDGAFKVNPGHEFVHAVEHLIGEGTLFVQAKTDILRFPRKASRFPPRR
jgi:DNA polymerase-3 subunit alpha